MCKIEILGNLPDIHMYCFMSVHTYNNGVKIKTTGGGGMQDTLKQSCMTFDLPSQIYFINYVFWSTRASEP